MSAVHLYWKIQSWDDVGQNISRAHDLFAVFIFSPSSSEPCLKTASDIMYAPTSIWSIGFMHPISWVTHEVYANICSFQYSWELVHHPKASYALWLEDDLPACCLLECELLWFVQNINKKEFLTWGFLLVMGPWYILPQFYVQEALHMICIWEDYYLHENLIYIITRMLKMIRVVIMHSDTLVLASVLHANKDHLFIFICLLLIATITQFGKTNQ